MLIAIARHPDLTVRDLARQVGVTERAAAHIVRALEDERYITSRRVGRRKQYAVEPSRPMRHPLAAAHQVGELLAVLAPSDEPGGSAASPEP